MLTEVIKMEVKGSLDYARATTYILSTHEHLAVKKRPVMVICPGGAYAYTSVREAEPLAMQFNAMGYHAIVLDYSCAPARFPVALTELAYTVKLARDKEEEWGVDTDRVFIMGSSAGGHLVASYGCFYREDFLREALSCDAEKLKPTGIILNYPVITSGEYAHHESIKNLLGDRYEEMKDSVSLENRVTKDNPPAFVWHTFTDGSVPVENSLMYATAMHKAGVPCELHVFPAGGHGLSLANEYTLSTGLGEKEPYVARWIEMAKDWLLKSFGPLRY